MDPQSPDEYNAYDLSEFTPDELASIDGRAPTIPLQHTPLSARSRRPSSPDSYDAYALAEFSAADLAAVDASAPQTTAATLALALGCLDQGEVAFGGPRIAVELEDDADFASDSPLKGDYALRRRDGGKAREARVEWSQRSPFYRHRRWKGNFSVSDLVAPTWCEVQYDYGLRQSRARDLDRRPSTLVTHEGKTIVVAKEVAASNERITERGRKIHKTLEKKVKPVEVKIKASTNTERWALRLVNMLASLDSILEFGYTREIPVFGITHNELVVGIIDEIRWKPIFEANSKSSPSRKRPPSPTQDTSRDRKKSWSPPPFPPQPPAVSNDAPIESTSHSSPSPPRTHRFHLIDTKTRRTRNLPSEDDSLSSRLQLMLYHRLLTNLLSPDFPFAAFWQRCPDVSPTVQLSDTFLAQAGLVATPMRCLDDLARSWQASVSAMNVDGVSPQLEIVYLAQRKRRESQESPPNGKSENKNGEDISEQEALDLERAILESLKQEYRDQTDVLVADFPVVESGQRQLADVTALETGVESAERLADAVETPLDLPENGDAIVGDVQESCYAEAAEPSMVAVIGDVPCEGTMGTIGDVESGVPTPTVTPPNEAGGSSSQERGPRFIGEKIFDMDDQLLDAHLTSVLEFWHGKRAPKGVEIEQTSRCYTCEYMDGCEWREKKAFDADIAQKGKKKQKL